MIPALRLKLLALASVCAFAVGLIPALEIWKEKSAYSLKSGKAGFVGIDLITRKNSSRNSTQQFFSLGLNFTWQSEEKKYLTLPLFMNSEQAFTNSNAQELREIASQLTSKNDLEAYCSSTKCVVEIGISAGRVIWLIFSAAMAIFFMVLLFSRTSKK